jgi:P-type E1-E2 ATPase
VCTFLADALLMLCLQKRHQSDAELNARKAKVLNSQGHFVDTKWKDISVGDVVRMESDDFIPADMVLVSSSEPEGLCYIETSNLDGYAMVADIPRAHIYESPERPILR